MFEPIADARITYRINFRLIRLWICICICIIICIWLVGVFAGVYGVGGQVQSVQRARTAPVDVHPPEPQLRLHVQTLLLPQTHPPLPRHPTTAPTQQVHTNTHPPTHTYICTYMPCFFQ